MFSLAVQHPQSFLNEYSLASGTGKGMLSYMEIHVSFQVVTRDESFTTPASLYRCSCQDFPSVISPVLDKVGRVRETLSTLDTSIWLDFYMLHLMDKQ